MIDALTFDILLIIMMFVLNRAGVSLRRSGRILSPAGISAILVFTLNEGLRFGRGLEYNKYGIKYEELAKGGDVNWDFNFQFIAKFLIALDMPWQGYVMLMSFIFILATVLLLKNYREILPYALPLFVFFSRGDTQAMIRWYMAFSFVMIGLAILLNDTATNRRLKFLFFSILACTFHLAMAPVPLVFYFVRYWKSPLLSPLYILGIYWGITFFFQTDFMLQFVNIANTLSVVSERFQGYSDNAEYWLTAGYAGTMRSSFPAKLDLIFYCTIVILGYTAIKKCPPKCVFAYNLFIIGLWINPIALQIELAFRFCQVFFIFRAIIIACIIDYVFVKKKVALANVFVILFFISFINIGKRLLYSPFSNPDKYLYVWNKRNLTYEQMYEKWMLDLYEQDDNTRKEKE